MTGFRKYKRDNSVLFMYILSPAVCSIMCIKRILKGDMSVCWIVPYIMGIFAFLFPPYSDFARNLDLVYTLKDSPLSVVFITNSDYVVPLIERFFIKNGIPIEIFRFLYTYLVYYWMNNIFYDLANKRNLDKRHSTYLWCLLFMTISFFVYIINLRTLFVNYALMYSIYKICYCNQRKYYMLVIFSGFVHFAYIPIIITFIVSRFITLEFNLKSKIFFSIIFMILASFAEMTFFLDIVNMLPLNDVLLNKISIYTEGEWSANGDANKQMRTANYIIYTTLSSLSTYYMYYVYIKNYSTSKYESYLSFLFVLLFITASVPSLYGRYIGFLNTAILLHIIVAYANGSINSKRIRNLLLLQLFTTSLNVYAHWNCLVNGNVYLLLLPLPYSIFQTYDFIEWCKHHLSGDFNEFINKSNLSRE